jgi:acetyl-CoA C-acetyltransferase
MTKVYVTAAKRTAIGRMQGSLAKEELPDLAVGVIKNVIEETGIEAGDLDEVIMGSVLTANSGPNVARIAALRAGVPVEVPAYTLNILCGSGMKSVINGYNSIMGGMNNIVLAGGMESMSGAPHLLPKDLKRGIKMGGFQVEDSMMKDGLIDAFNHYHMGVTAENVAKKHNISREEQDEFAYNSQMKAAKAQREGRLAKEILPYEVKTRKGVEIFDQDEHINPDTTLEGLAKLKPAFLKDGTVTAGSSSGINDAAAAMVLVSEEVVKEKGLKPIAEIVAVAQAGVDPEVMGLGPVPATRKVLEKANMKLSQMEVIELNEAFAAQSLGVITEWAEEHDLTKEEIIERTNLDGGAIALGHPIAVSGNRIIASVIRLLKERKQTYGLATLCIGGGMGLAVIIKNIEE